MSIYRRCPLLPTESSSKAWCRSSPPCTQSWRRISISCTSMASFSLIQQIGIKRSRDFEVSLCNFQDSRMKIPSVTYFNSLVDESKTFSKHYNLTKLYEHGCANERLAPEQHRSKTMKALHQMIEQNKVQRLMNNLPRRPGNKESDLEVWATWNFRLSKRNRADKSYSTSSQLAPNTI